MIEDHTGPICAQLGHFVGSLVVVYCPHRQGWTLVLAAGDDADDTCIDHRLVTFGPFDSDEDVASEVRGRISEMIRVTKGVWADSRRASPEDTQD